MSEPTRDAAPIILDDSSGTFVLGQMVGSDMLLGLSLLLVIVALVAIVGTVMARKETRLTARIARDRARKMSELLRTVRMAESIAELGVWQYDPSTGEQQWSDGMRALFGIDHDDTFDDGDAETLLFANEINLIDSVVAHRDHVGPFDMRYDIVGYDGVTRSLSVQACHLRGSSGAVARVVAVVRDVTDQVTREQHLEQSRAVALSEARHARQLAETDALTGLANRRRVMDELDRMLMTVRGQGKALSLVVFDIDHFKAVNDTYGHPRGDHVLQKIANIALSQARDVDLVGRVGGEEFVWIIPGADEGLARIVAERLRQAVAKGSGTGAVPPVTTSVGFAEMTAEDTSLSLFARADAALYEAKNSGRNRVRMAA